jgi:hypothetical protein
MGWRRQCPHARIVLVGFGTGAHVALLSTFYTAPGTLDRVILLSASVAADYDLRSALHASREGVDSFYSELDSTICTCIDHVGLADGRRCPAGGTVGFNGGFARQCEPMLFCKLRQYGWNQRWECLHHQGDLHGYTHTEWVEAYLWPLATGRLLYP